MSRYGRGSFTYLGDEPSPHRGCNYCGATIYCVGDPLFCPHCGSPETEITSLDKLTIEQATAEQQVSLWSEVERIIKEVT